MVETVVLCCGCADDERLAQELQAQEVAHAQGSSPGSLPLDPFPTLPMGLKNAPPLGRCPPNVPLQMQQQQQQQPQSVPSVTSKNPFSPGRKMPWDKPSPSSTPSGDPFANLAPLVPENVPYAAVSNGHGHSLPSPQPPRTANTLKSVRLDRKCLPSPFSAPEMQSDPMCHKPLLSSASAEQPSPGTQGQQTTWSSGQAVAPYFPASGSQQQRPWTATNQNSAAGWSTLPSGGTQSMLNIPGWQWLHLPTSSQQVAQGWASFQYPVLPAEQGGNAGRQAPFPKASGSAQSASSKQPSQQQQKKQPASQPNTDFDEDYARALQKRLDNKVRPAVPARTATCHSL